MVDVERYEVTDAKKLTPRNLPTKPTGQGSNVPKFQQTNESTTSEFVENPNESQAL